MESGMDLQYKKCPFCGNDAKLFPHGYNSTNPVEIGCSSNDCLVKPMSIAYPKVIEGEVMWNDAEKEAVDKWNTRA